MTGFVALLGHRNREVLATWRVWVLPSVLLLFAATGPPTARYTRELLTWAMGDQASLLQTVDPTYLDSYAQWSKNLTQLVVFVVVIMAAGAINGEVRSGSAVLLLVKPVSRTSFVLAHAVSLFGFVAVATAVGTAVTWVGTWLLFPEAPPGPLIVSTAVWLVLIAVLIAMALLASAAVDAVAGAAGIGIGGFFLLAILGAVPAAAKHSPAGLTGLVGNLSIGEHMAVTWPVVTGAALAVVLLAAAVVVFSRREL
ncbi:MAG: ABC transporter permease subunit [Micrococcales bacterium]|nr:ABC transporter permease subunit [Micrococcales bacterium]